MSIAEVIRRGNRRRTITIAQRSAGGLSAIALGAAMLFTGATHHARHVQAASGSTGAGDHSLSVTTFTPVGDMTMQITYKLLSPGKMTLVAVSYSGEFKKDLKNPVLNFVLGAPLAGFVSKKPIVIRDETFRLNPKKHNFRGSLSAKDLKGFAGASFQANRSFHMALSSTVSDRSQQDLDATVILTSR